MLYFELDIKPPPGPPRLNNLAQRDIKSSHLRPLLKVRKRGPELDRDTRAFLRGKRSAYLIRLVQGLAREVHLGNKLLIAAS